MQDEIKFYSNKFKKTIYAELLEKRKTTVKLRLDSGEVIVKKIKQIAGE